MGTRFSSLMPTSWAPHRATLAEEVLDPMLDVVLKRFDAPDETRVFDKGRFEIVRVGGMTIGRATYEPGWRWSVHVGASLGQTMCQVEHVGMVVSGIATAAMEDGRVFEMKPGNIFYVPPGHDSWVVGDEPYVSLHFLGAEQYANK
jgi:mannose-6-phosphate isomerase-like protein (cupin superfamily)